MPPQQNEKSESDSVPPLKGKLHCEIKKMKWEKSNGDKIKKTNRQSMVRGSRIKQKRIYYTNTE